jgi:hypothetical protein
MAEQLKRWNGTAWVNVVTVNRLEVSGESGDFLSPSNIPREADFMFKAGGYTWAADLDTVFDSGIAIY